MGIVAGTVGQDTLLGSLDADTLDGMGGDDLLDGSFGADSLLGGAGNDTLIGSEAGALVGDTLLGGNGDELYVIGNALDLIVEGPGEGFDEIRTDLVAYTLVANAEALTYTGTATFSGVGSALDNLIIGGAGADKLEGGGGNDMLDGGAGDDQLFGGDGDDLLFGGDGDDRLFGGDGDDLLFGGGGNDQLFCGDGNDTLVLDSDPLSIVSWGADSWMIDTGNGLIQVENVEFCQVGPLPPVTISRNIKVAPSISIAAASADRMEHNSGNAPVTFKLTRGGDISGEASVQYTVTGWGDTPADADDFGGTLPSGRIHFAAGEDSKTLTLYISGDAVVEADETFAVTLSDPVGAKLRAGSSVSGTIWDDDAPQHTAKILSIPQTPTGDPAIDTELSGVQWDTTTLTYSFPATIEDISNGFDLPSEEAFELLSDADRAAFVSVLDSWSCIAGVTFRQASAPDLGDIRVYWYRDKSNPTAKTFALRSWGSEAGDIQVGDSVFLDVGRYSWAPGSYGYVSLIHELGHALGLKHPHSAEHGFPAADPATDSLEVSVMSYRSYMGGSETEGYRVVPGSFPVEPMVNDIAAIQHLYGPNWSTNSDDTTYRFDPAAPVIFGTTWDGGGNDTYDLSNYTTDLRLDLRPGQWCDFGDQRAQLRPVSVIDGILVAPIYAAGNIANAYLYDDNTASLIENATGGDGNDLLIGNQAGNRLVGNGGNDTLRSGDGDDTLLGGGGDDELASGSGNDVIEGGPGYDTLVLTAMPLAVVRQDDGSWAINTGAGIATVRTVELLKIGALAPFAIEAFGVAPTLAITTKNIIASEGNSGSTMFTFTVTRSGDITGASSVAYAVTGAGINAADAADFGDALPRGTACFAPGETVQTITIAVAGERKPEADESFVVTLSDASGATIISGTATGTIRDDDSDTTSPGGNDGGAVGHDPVGDQVIDGIIVHTRVGKAPNGIDLNFVETDLDQDVPASDENGITLTLMHDGDNAPLLQAQVSGGGRLAAYGPQSTISGSRSAEVFDAMLASVLSDEAGAEIRGAMRAFTDIAGSAIQMTVRTLTPKGFGTVTITGSSSPNAPRDAVILDMNNTSGGAVVLNHVDFAAIVGKGTFTGGEGNSLTIGDDEAQSINLGPGDDTTRGGGGDDVVASTTGRDLLAGEAGNDTLYGGADDDTLLGGDGNDLGGGGIGDDLISGDTGNDVLIGEDGNDTLIGGGGDDILFGMDGADLLTGDSGADTVVAGNGNDTILGGEGSDLIGGGEGDDLIDGGADNDTLIGEAGDDTLFGGTGNDTLWGFAGDDWLIGGSGQDIFAFTLGGGNDRVFDFNPGDDILGFAGPGISIAELMAAAQTVGHDTVFTLSDKSTITVVGLTNVTDIWFTYPPALSTP